MVSVNAVVCVVFPLVPVMVGCYVPAGVCSAWCPVLPDEHSGAWRRWARRPRLPKPPMIVCAESAAVRKNPRTAARAAEPVSLVTKEASGGPY